MVKTTILEKLTEKLRLDFEPEFIEVQNESQNHNVPAGSETHLKVILVSKKFHGLNKIKRHQSVYQAASEWMNNPIHALAMHLFTEEEWDIFKTKNLDSPLCRGGEK